MVLVTAIWLAVASILSGCIVVPREGYYDHEHHRWWHERAWHDCGDRDERCRD
jgi:hypothetical protein